MLHIEFANIKNVYDEHMFADGTRTLTIVLKDGKMEKTTDRAEIAEFFNRYAKWLAKNQEQRPNQ